MLYCYCCLSDFSVFPDFRTNLNHSAISNNRAFFHYHNAILHYVSTVIAIGKRLANVYRNVIADAGVFVDNSVADMAPVANTHNRRLAFVRFCNLLQRLVVIITHYVAVFNNGFKAYAGTDTYQ